MPNRNVGRFFSITKEFFHPYDAVPYKYGGSHHFPLKTPGVVCDKMSENSYRKSSLPIGWDPTSRVGLYVHFAKRFKDFLAFLLRYGNAAIPNLNYRRNIPLILTECCKFPFLCRNAASLCQPCTVYTVRRMTKYLAQQCVTQTGNFQTYSI